MGLNRTLLRSSTAAAALSAFLAPVPVLAQAQTWQFDLPAQSLDKSLRSIARQTRQQVTFEQSAVRGKIAPAVKGNLTTEQALAIALTRSGMGASRGQSGLFIVRPQGELGNAGAAVSAAASQIEGRGTIVGTVRDNTTGAALKGALVELIGTGRQTSTDDLGEFRFSGVAAGNAEVRISFLGYAEAHSTIGITGGETRAQDFTLIGGSAGQEIVVYGNRSARAQALNQERTAENIQTVISSDLLGQFDGSTISDALRRVPGVAFEQDPVTGDGANIIVRGLAPDFNTVTLNGLRLPEGSGTGRSASLANILTDSISKVTINKSLLPSHDSTGTGGLIDIETKGPLDRPRRFASISGEGGRSGKGFLKENSVSATISGTFGEAENFGLSASVQYRKRDIQRYSYSAFNNGKFKYLPLDADGNPITSEFGLDPEVRFPFGGEGNEVYPDSVTTGYSGSETKNLAVTLAGQWKIGSHTNLRFDFVRSQSETDAFERTTLFDPFEVYQIRPVDELGGELRAVLVTQNRTALSPGATLNATQDYSFSEDVKSVTDTYSFRGRTATGPWEFNYDLGYADGSTETPLSARTIFIWRLNLPTRRLPSSVLSDQALANTTSDGRAISLFAPFGGNVFPVPLYNQSGFDALSNPAEWYLAPNSGIFISTGDKGQNKRYTAKGNVKYSFDSDFLKYVEIGGFFESARFSRSPVDGDNRYEVQPPNFGGPLVSMADLGLGFSGTSLAPIGIEGGADVVPRSGIEDLFTNIEEVLANNPNLTQRFFDPFDARLAKTFTNEDNFSLYVMPRLQLGKLEIIAGVRLDRVNIKTRAPFNPSLFDENFAYDAAFSSNNSVLADGKAKQTTLLPRAAATWRLSDSFLVRSGFGISVARPQIQFLNGPQSLTFFLSPLFGPNSNQPALFISIANPDLKPSRTRNYDFSIERYFSDVGQVKLSLFYKTIDNLLGFASADTSESLAGINIPDDPRLADLSNFYVQATQPINGENPAKVYGLEVAVEKRFTFLPGALSGLGFYGNYTYTKGKREIQGVDNNNQNFRRTVPLSGAPKHSGTAALTYNKYGIDATLAYTMQGRRFDGFGNYGFDFYNEADSSLDLRAEYRFDRGPGNWRIWVEASDILKGANDADVVSSQGGANGVPKIYTGGNYYGGRRGTLGVSVNF